MKNIQHSITVSFMKSIKIIFSTFLLPIRSLKQVKFQNKNNNLQRMKRFASDYFIYWIRANVKLTN